MNAMEITKDWLAAHGYDGLYAEGECGCCLDNFMPCEGDVNNVCYCEAGYKAACDPDDEFCADHEFGWHIQAEKPSPAEEMCDPTTMRKEP
jgi:hypothetical protein